jgi:hypothetical protein
MTEQGTSSRACHPPSMAGRVGPGQSWGWHDSEPAVKARDPLAHGADRHIAAGCLPWLLGDRQVAVLVGHEPAVVGVAGKDLVQRGCASQRSGSVRVSVQDIERAEPEDQGLDIADHVFDVIFTEGKQPQTAPNKPARLLNRSPPPVPMSRTSSAVRRYRATTLE